MRIDVAITEPMKLLRHAQLSTALCVVSAGLMLVGTIFGVATVLAWGLAVAAWASTCTLTYYSKKERLRIETIVNATIERERQRYEDDEDRLLRPVT